MNEIFDWCVDLLEYVAPFVGMTYKELNVWLFVIVHPIITLGLAASVIILINRNKTLRIASLKNQ